MKDMTVSDKCGDQTGPGTCLAMGLLWLIAHGIAALPLHMSLALGRGLGRVFGSVIRYHRRDALEALARSLPDLDTAAREEIIKRMYAHFGMNLVESLRLAGGKLRQVEMMEQHGIDQVHQALERNKGALILTAHFGNWDLLSVLTPRIGFPLTIISKDVKNRALNTFWMDMRRAKGLSIVPAHQSYRKCRAALKRNELVGFILDQNMIDKEGIFVDFFGRPACTTPGLAFMAAQSGAPVIPVFTRRLENGRHEMRVYPPLDPPPDREPETIREATQQYTRIIEDMVRQYPDQWIWIHRRWRTQPPD
jgi:KDO2-lipid IV(A) lauroyltransferase